MAWDGTDRERVAQELEDTAVQMAAGNLLRYDAARRLLDGGRVSEAIELLEEAVHTQRALLADLRRLVERLRPKAELTPP